jgi:DNA-binding response OmpR family regulator
MPSVEQKNAKLLLVDDEPDILELLVLRLEAHGYNIITGQDGKEALDLIKKHRPDLIIMDVMMPPPDGFDVCKEIKNSEDYKDIPLILLTARCSKKDISKGSDVGADLLLPKPYDPQLLLSSVRNFLEPNCSI